MLTSATLTCPIDELSSNNPGWHVSYRDWPKASWVVYSAQGDISAEMCNNDSGYAAPGSGNWNTYDDEVVLARLDANNDPTKIFRLTLAHSRNECVGGNFWFDPRAAISFDGKYIIFDSNAAWAASGCGALTNCTDVYAIHSLEYPNLVYANLLYSFPKCVSGAVMTLISPGTTGGGQDTLTQVLATEEPAATKLCLSVLTRMLRRIVEPKYTAWHSPIPAKWRTIGPNRTSQSVGMESTFYSAAMLRSTRRDALYTATVAIPI